MRTIRFAFLFGVLGLALAGFAGCGSSANETESGIVGVEPAGQNGKAAITNYEEYGKAQQNDNRYSSGNYPGGQ